MSGSFILSSAQQDEAFHRICPLMCNWLFTSIHQCRELQYDFRNPFSFTE
ncbi:unnamed protein product [Spirodela intermedia]|uniref:Uncharacterized protein n=1 Tax=Spirodela intermedia TaxID=51605 RepID=A0A7I8L4I5_SPIIN|nr:unnamed protein product [Spirodela intermedia]